MSAWEELHAAMDGNLRMSRRRALLDAHRKEIRHEVAKEIRAAKVPSPLGETEEHVNHVLDDLADAIDSQRGHQ